MARKTALVKLSGDLINRLDVREWLRNLAKEKFVVVVSGGGTQINTEFEARGYGKNYGPLGRETKSFDERQLARDILEKNQAEIQDMLAKEGISAVVLIPVLDIGSVLCHINGDIFVLTAYLGYDELFVLTLEGREKGKEKQLEELWRSFGGTGMPPKIKVVGFHTEQP